MKGMNARGTSISRRDLLKAAGAFGAAGMIGALTGCSGAQDSATPASIAFDEEHDFVVVGSGTGLFGAMAAKGEGKDVLLLEKSTVIGGTTFMCGSAFWFPANSLMDDLGVSDTAEAATEYMMNCDLWGIADESLCRDYAANARTVCDYTKERLGLPWTAPMPLADYYLYPGAAAGRSVLFGEAWADFRTRVTESYADMIRTGTEVTSLITDSSGRVVGVVARTGTEETRIKANSGVLLATGGFDHNETMRKTYLNSLLLGTVTVAGNTGDGHKMGMALGADVKAMSGVFATVAYIKEGADAEMGTDPTAFDHFYWRILPNSYVVNMDGRRFMDETQSYDSVGRALGNVEASRDPFISGPAVFICDSTLVQNYGYPGVIRTGLSNLGMEKPEWLREYHTLAELCDGEGIAKERFCEENARFSAFCDAGVDRDFRRGESGWGLPNGVGTVFSSGVTRDDLANPFLGKVEKAPFYAAKIGMGSFSTTGGLVVNEYAQVMKEGEPIPGLYAAGCTAVNYSGYMGAGVSVGSGLYRSIRAVDHAMNLGVF